jgi:heavy metal sensor kinase
MINSFRLRLALLSALLTGLSLVAFGLGTWWLIRDIKIERIDAEVRTNAEREVSRVRSAAEWAHIESKLVSTLGVRDSVDLLLLVQDGSGQTIYRSPHWPAGLDSARLPWPERQVAKKARGIGLMPISEARAADSGLGMPLLLAQVDRGRESSQSGPRDSDPAYREQPSRLETQPAEMQQEPDPPRPESRPPGPPPGSKASSLTADGRTWRIGLASTQTARIAVAVDAQVIDADMKGIRNAFLIALPMALILIGFGGWAFSSRALRPLQKLTAATRRVTAEGLDQRILVQGEDNEFVELIELFNSMLARLERSFKQAHRFSADAAHELKTPLAILQGQLERAIHSAEVGSAMQAELSGILDEVRRLSTISRKLLLLSQADAGRLKVHREPFDLSKALAELAEDTRMLAPHLKVTSKVHPDLIIGADGSLLRQVFHNLISNAIKYNVDDGWISISTVVRSQVIEVVVSNSSPGIPIEARDRIFERFFRADPAHSRQVEGVGLGLSVSREIARAHGGDITFKADSDGTVGFSLLLPLAVSQ